MVTREELGRRLWPGDTFVDFEHGLNAAVNRLRKPSETPPNNLASSRPFRDEDTGSLRKWMGLQPLAQCRPRLPFLKLDAFDSYLVSPFSWFSYLLPLVGGCCRGDCPESQLRLS